MALLLPGDLGDLHVFLLTRMDHGIAATVPSVIARVRREDVLDLFHTRPRLTTALWWNTLQDEAVLRESLLNISQRRAPERFAHLFWEMYLRYEAVGLAPQRRPDLDAISKRLQEAAEQDRASLMLMTVHLGSLSA